MALCERDRKLAEEAYDEWKNLSDADRAESARSWAAGSTSWGLLNQHFLHNRFLFKKTQMCGRVCVEAAVRMLNERAGDPSDGVASSEEPTPSIGLLMSFKTAMPVLCSTTTSGVMSERGWWRGRIHMTPVTSLVGLLCGVISIGAAGYPPGEGQHRDNKNVDHGVLLFCGEPTNDIFKAAVVAAASVGNEGLVRRVSVAECSTAATALPDRSGVVLVADSAPAQPVVLPSTLLDVVATRAEAIRLFVEFASPPPTASFAALDRWPCPDFSRVVASPGSTMWARGDTATHPLDVLEPNACSYIPYWSKDVPSSSCSHSQCASRHPGMTRTDGVALDPSTHLVLAKVAGFTTAVYGLNDTSTVRVLWTPPAYSNMLLSGLPLSAARRHRYSPTASWRGLWHDVLRWLLWNDGDPSTVWTDHLGWAPIVGATLDPADPLPKGTGIVAVRRALNWVHSTSQLLATAEALKVSSSLGLWVQNVGQASLAATGWPMELTPLGGCGNTSSADGSHGIFECYMSAIQPRGGGVGGNVSTQLLRPVVRTDCVGEAAGGLAVGAWSEVGDERAAAVATNLLDYLLLNSTALNAWPRSDPNTSVGGTMLWAINVLPPHQQTIYADDQCRIFYSAAFAGAVLNMTRWERPLAHLLLGNLRLMNRAGYFHTSVTADEVMAAGWRSFFNDTSHNENNYYQAAGRAVMLLGYRLTSDAIFLERTVAGLASSMSAFYDSDLVCQVGLTSEAARMLLPLAWLVRVNDTALHRRWVSDIADVLLRRQVPCGAIHELPYGMNDSTSGRPKSCMHRPPASNAEYGTGESTMAQTAADPASDLLYSNNFALHALHEAAVATGNATLAHAATALHDFIVRAQTTVHGEGFDPADMARAVRLNGTWLRSFDFERWEPYAQGSDWAWGPWVAETGHGVSLITMTLASMQRGTSMWDVITSDPSTRARFAEIIAELKPLYFGNSS